MKRELLEDLAIRGGIYDCICDPYDKLKNGNPYSSVMGDLDRFAEKIVRLCADIAMREDQDPAKCILDYFGVDNKSKS
jgi:hypothetical protein